GWDNVPATGRIPYDSSVAPLGGHAFAVVAYDADGFWIQNSWGTDWGKKGFGHVAYEDWLKNATDVWVARLGVPTTASSRRSASTTAFGVSARARASAVEEVRAHVVSLGNDGELRPNGNIGTTEEQLRKTNHEDLPRVMKNWVKRRVVLYAHGGLVSEEGAVQRVAEYREPMLQSQCYPLAFIWHTDYLSTLVNILTEALRLRRPEGFIEGAKDFLLDRLDDALEPIARKLTGKASWDEMKENALAATESERGGARFVIGELAKLVSGTQGLEFHVVAHSAGAILLAPLVRRLTGAVADGGLGQTIQSCTLWAPACTTALFEQTYAPAIENGSIKRFALYTLTDKAERDDNCGRLYNKSLLYLVSHAFERRARILVFHPDGEPLLGMERYAKENAAVKRLLNKGLMDLVLAPNDKPLGDIGATAANAHAAFDDDKATVLSTLARVVGKKTAAGPAKAALSIRVGKTRLSRARQELNQLDVVVVNRT
ncbi:MAG: C1 family peptidase, partial [Gemmatimonadaceae bacterium]